MSAPAYLGAESLTGKTKPAVVAESAQDGKLLAVSPGTKVRVEMTQRTRLKRGQPVEAKLAEPIYVENRLAVPLGARVEGRIADVRPIPRSKRLDAKFHGDFTPLSEPVIQFTTLTIADGRHYPMEGEVNGGAGTTLYFRSARAKEESIFRKAWETVVGRKNSAINMVKAPGKMDRLEKFFWSQMPYHPQSVEEGTQYEASFVKELRLPGQQSSPETASAEQKPLQNLVTVHARLRSELDSGRIKNGDPVEAVVTEPVVNEANQLIIAQGSMLRGKVLQATPSRRWGRNGLLRFSFTEISLPSGFQQQVEGIPTAIAASPNTKLQMDREGGVTQETNRSIMAPLVLGLLSTSALKDDDADLGHSATASNGFAIIGRLVAIGIGSKYVTAGIGMAATGRSVYTRWLAHGKEMRFGQDTEVQLQVSPERAHRMGLDH